VLVVRSNESRLHNKWQDQIESGTGASVHQKMDRYPSFLGRGQDTRASGPSYQQTELSESDYSDSHAGRVDTQYYDGGPQSFFSSQPEPKYEVYQTENQAEQTGSPSSMTGDLVANPFAGLPNSLDPTSGWPDVSHQQFNVLVEDHDAQSMPNDYTGRPHQNQMALLDNVSHQLAVPTYESTRPEPWNPLQASYPAPMNGFQPMHSHSSPSSQMDSHEMHTQAGFPRSSIPGRTSALDMHVRLNDIVMQQPSAAFINLNDGTRHGSDTYNTSLSPIQCPWYGRRNPVTGAAPDSQSAGVDSYDR
jgi:hypothetical protein